MPLRLFEAFPAMAISFAQSSPHTDKDSGNGLCFVMPFGEFTGTYLNQSIDQSINQSMNQSIDQSINQSINQSID